MTVNLPAKSGHPATRSRVSNRRKLLDGVDGRSVKARRFRDLVADFAADLGGADVLTVADWSLIRQAAIVTVEAETMQAALLNDQAIDRNDLVRLTNASARILGVLRSKPRTKPVETLQEYIERTRKKQS